MIRPIRNRKKVVAARATERGIAGHQAAMKALGKSSGWGKMDLFGTEMAISNKSPLDAPYTRAFKPGESNLDVIPGTLFGKPLVRPSKPGSHTYSNKTEEETALVNKNKRPAKDENNGN